MVRKLGKEALELFVVNAVTLVLVDTLDQSLNINRHFELVPNHVNQFVGIDVPCLVGVSAHGHECVDCLKSTHILFVIIFLGVLVLLVDAEELVELDFAGVFLVDLVDHREQFLLRRLVPHLLQYDAEFEAVDAAGGVLVKLAEDPFTPGDFLFAQSHFIARRPPHFLPQTHKSNMKLL